MFLKFLSWNCRGAKSAVFHRHLRHLVESHKPNMLALLEPKVHSNKSISRICHYASLNRFACVEAQGFSGGIWLLWDDESIDFELVAADHQTIMGIVRFRHQVFSVLSVVYASPHYVLRSSLWGYLKTLGNLIAIPWLLVGDWNQVISQEDKLGGRPVTSSLTSSLWSVISDCGLVDVGFSGCKFTWSNLRLGPGCIRERLDQAWCNGGWQHCFSDINVKHLVRSHSDYCPILLSTEFGLGQRQPRQSFHMLTAWFQHPGLEAIVRQAGGSGALPLMPAMDAFRGLASYWNRTCFGNIFADKRRCHARLTGVQQQLERYNSKYLAELESQLLAEFNLLLRREEELWRQKANAQWLRSGERNSKFFHATAAIRRKCRCIVQLKGDDDLWCDDLERLETMAAAFYQNLYTSKGSSPCSHLEWAFLALHHAESLALNRTVSDTIVTIALFQMGPDKAAGPDGFLPRFFQRFWGIVGDSGVIQQAENKTLICLLPKVHPPESISQLRPIALCNVLSKLVMKILANRLKPLMLQLTGPQQASFIPGRQAVDNVVIVQELIHTLQWKKGLTGGMILKVDLEKAYDRVEWPFLRQVILAAGFSEHLTNLIMSCISSTSFMEWQWQAP